MVRAGILTKHERDVLDEFLRTKDKDFRARKLASLLRKNLPEIHNQVLRAEKFLAKYGRKGRPIGSKMVK